SATAATANSANGSRIIAARAARTPKRSATAPRRSGIASSTVAIVELTMFTSVERPGSAAKACALTTGCSGAASAKVNARSATQTGKEEVRMQPAKTPAHPPDATRRRRIPPRRAGIRSTTASAPIALSVAALHRRRAEGLEMERAERHKRLVHERAQDARAAPEDGGA